MNIYRKSRATTARRYYGDEAVTRQGETRRWLHEHGLCCDCKQKDAFTMNGRWRCADCAEKYNERKREQRNKNPGKYSEEEKAFRELHKKSGLCVQCKRPAIPGLTMCVYHRNKNRNRKRAEYARNHEMIYGACRCGKPLMEGKRLCADCCAKMTKSLIQTWTPKARNHYWKKMNNLLFQSPSE